ncbi:MAG: TolB family protein [Gemmatimonadaceae bacterium]
MAHMRSIRAVFVVCAVAPLLFLATCTSTDDCAAGNPLMPVCVTPARRVLFLRAWDSTWTRSDLYTMNIDGTDVRRLTTDGMRTAKMAPSYAAWSADGRQIAWARRADSSMIRSQIFTIDDDGTHLRNVSNQSAAFDWAPDWSPDGTRIVFQSDRHNPATTTCCVTSLYVMNADGSDVRRLTTGGNDKLPRWSPDGTTIVFNSDRAGGQQLFVMNADGTNIRQRTSVGTSRKAAWSPTGDMIAFEGTRDAAAGGMGAGIYVMSADGSGQMVVSSGAVMDMSPSWSHDGREIYFCSIRGSGGKMHIYAVPATGGAARQVSAEGTEDCCPDTDLPAQHANGVPMRALAAGANR